MDLPERNSEESMPVAEAALEEEPLPSIDLRLIDAVLNPQFRRIVLRMEEKIQKFMLNPELHEIELPNFDSSYLREITGILARYYGLKPLSTESTRVFAREMTPNRRMPSLTLSTIPPAEPEEDLTAGSKFIGIFTILKRQNCGASSRNFPEPKTRRSMEERDGRDGEYYMARARIFNESVSSSSNPPVVSRSISPVQSEIFRDGGQDGTGGRRRIRIPLHNPGANQNSNQTGDQVGTGPRSRIRIPVHNPGANQNSSQTVDQDGTSPRLRIRIPVHNPGANQNSNQTSPRPGRRITHPPPLIIEQDPTLDDASNFLHQPMQYPSMQYGQPALPPYDESLYPYVPALPPYDESLYPYVLDPYGSYPMYQYHPYLASDPPYNPAYVNYMPWSMQSLNHGLYNPVYSGYMQCPLVPSTQSLIQEPMNFQPSVTDFDELLQYYGESIERPSTPYLDASEARTFPSRLAPPFYPYDPANSTYMQRSMPQSTQPRSVATQRSSTSVAFQIQRQNNVTGRLQRLGMGARQPVRRRESTNKGRDRNRRWSL